MEAKKILQLKSFMNTFIIGIVDLFRDIFYIYLQNYGENTTKLGI